MPEAGQISQPGPFWDEGERLRRMRAVIGDEQLTTNSVARCVPVMMVALDWFGAPRTLAGLFSGSDAGLTLGGLRAFLAEQGFETGFVSADEDLSGLRPGSLLLADDGRAVVYLGVQEGRRLVHDGTAVGDLASFGAIETILSIIRVGTGGSQPGQSWLTDFILRNLKEPLGILGVSGFVNVLALAVSLFTMTVYNHVIPSGSTDTLTALLIAAMIGLIGGWGLRLGRVWAMARYGGWAGYEFGTAALGKTLNLPYDVSSRLGIIQSLNRFRSMEGTRQFLSGAGGTAFIDGPFVVIFILVIALLGGWIALVPIFGLALMIALAGPLAHLVDGASRKVGQASTAFMDMTATIVTNLQSLKAIGQKGHWIDRYADLSTELALANRTLAARSNLMQTIGHAVSMATVLSTMVVGVLLVLNGTMNAGGLIAAMMLVWRIVGPAERAFTSVLRLRQLRSSGTQLDRLMATPGELSNPQLLSPVEPMAPALRVDRVVLRYTAEQEPALNGVGFAAEAGDVIAVIGPNGAGKTSLLECLAGLRKPQAGVITVGGRDMRQFDPTDYRAWIGYAAHRPNLFPLSVRQTLRLKRPESDDAILESSLREAGGAAWRDLLPDGLDTVLDPFDRTAENEHRLRLVGLALALVGQPPLVILDDPVEATDGTLNDGLKALLGARNRTVLFATHRPDLIRLADKVLVLDKGNVMHFGPVAAGSDEPSEGQNP